MYLDFEVEIPEVPGRINQVKKGNTTYVRYVVGRTYHPEKKYNIPDQRIIGKRSEKNPDRMIPNENYMKYFGHLELPEQKINCSRSSCLRIGTFLVIKKILEDYKLPQILRKYLGIKDSGLFLIWQRIPLSVKIMRRNIIRLMLITIRFLHKRCTYTVIQGFQIFSHM